MGSGHRHHLISFHLHHHHHGDGGEGDLKGVPKGCMAVMVGLEGEEQLQRFVIPVPYINHPLFMQLLKEAEEEYGFDHEGPITIPCHVEDFRTVRCKIEEEHHQHKSLHHHAHDSSHHYFLCFRA